MEPGQDPSGLGQRGDGEACSGVTAGTGLERWSLKESCENTVEEPRGPVEGERSPIAGVQAPAGLVTSFGSVSNPITGAAGGNASSVAFSVSGEAQRRPPRHGSEGAEIALRFPRGGPKPCGRRAYA